MKKLGVVLLISVAGAAIAWGAVVAFLSPASDRGPLEPRGLVESVPIAAHRTVEPSATPSPSPDASAAASSAPALTARDAEAGPAASVAPSGDAMRTPRAPSGLRDDGQGSTTVTQGVHAEQPPTEPCQDEASQRERERCERELEREDDADDETDDEATGD